MFARRLQATRRDANVYEAFHKVPEAAQVKEHTNKRVGFAVLSRLLLACMQLAITEGVNTLLKPPGTSSGSKRVKTSRQSWFWNSGPLPCDSSCFKALLDCSVLDKFIRVLLNGGI